ncbi:cysteine synthase A [Natranaerobius trueperi]|uniref:Cysteine synthase n=1 Tax=Natranaerobius trueperi TaxID=759412 RepID=A0A226BYN4_9FIRM|nr:cysteine synthase A [Natranaerobius trueperi]OWZ84041.1 cysteine synthase A [Natranaerobius trueperi]
MIVNNVSELIGDTPMIKLTKIDDLKSVNVYGKLESFNPGGSVKDRISLSMLQAAEEVGDIDKDTVIIEPTSGNTGIGLAMLAASKGYRLILVMPDSMSLERRNLLKGFGAELVLTPGNKGMKGAVEKAEELVKEYSNFFMPQQFNNSANPDIHKKTTAQEIINDLYNKRLDYFISGVGTGGTITGTSEILRKHFTNMKTIAVEPLNSAVLSGDKPLPHKIQGIGAGFIPNTLNLKQVDEIFKVEDKDAIESSKELMQHEGIMTGISSGAVLWTAKKIAKDNPGTTMVIILPDTGERYLSTSLFQDN